MTDLIIGFVFGILTSIIFSIGMYIADKKKKKRSLKDRLNISMVKPGQVFKIEHDNAYYKICTAKCITNDTHERKILIEIHWKDTGKNKDYKQQYVLPYSSKEFNNFHLLNYNEFQLPSADDDIQNNEPKKVKENKIQQKISELKEKLNIHIQKEEYEQARKIQNEIDALNKKLK